MSKLLKRLNDNQNKVADTNGIMKLQAWDYGVAQDLTNKQITATIANAGGFLFDLDLVSNGTEIDLDFKDSQLQKLTPDTYFLEIKVTDEAGDVSVFPTEGYATFTINKNLHATEGALVPQITFDTVLADVKTAMDKTVADYVKTIAKGDKGDKGDPGKDGKDGKDAEMPVIGGRNYVKNSSGLNGSPTVRPTLIGASSGSANATLTYQSDGILMTNLATNKTTEWLYEVAKAFTKFSDTPLTPGKPITFSADVMGTVPQAVLRYDINDGTAGKQKYEFFDINNTNWTHISTTATPTSTDTRLYFRIQGGKNNQYIKGWNGGETLKFRYVKIEEGNVATDWTPAPEDKADDANVVHNTGNETVAGTKTFSDKLTVNGASQADSFYKHLKKGTMSASIMEVLDDNLDGRQFSVGKYYSGFTHGNGLSLTGNGLTAIGGGESSSALLDKISKGETDTTALPASALGDEKLILTSDQDIYLLPGQQSAPNYEGNWRISTRGYWDRYDTASKKWVNIIGNNTGVLAQDSQVVHNTGNETVAGNKTFSGNTTMGGTLMTDSGWKTIPLLSGMSAGVHRYRILNGVVYVQVEQVKGAVDGGDMLTLPTEARPDVDLFFPWKTGDKSGNLHVWAKTGKISVSSGNSSDKTVTYSMVTSYPAV